MTRVNSAAIILETSHEITYSDGEHLFTVVAVPRGKANITSVTFPGCLPGMVGVILEQKVNRSGGVD